MVVYVISDVTVVIQLKEEGTQRVVHHDKLKPYRGGVKLSWASTAVSKAKKSWNAKR